MESEGNDTESVKNTAQELLDGLREMEEEAPGVGLCTLPFKLLIGKAEEIIAERDRLAAVRHGAWEEVEVTDYPESNLMVASMFCPKCKRYHNEVYHYGNPTEMARYCGFCGVMMDGDGK